MIKVSFHNEKNEKCLSNVDKKRYCNVDIKRKNCFFIEAFFKFQCSKWHKNLWMTWLVMSSWIEVNIKVGGVWQFKRKRERERDVIL